MAYCLSLPSSVINPYSGEAGSAGTYDRISSTLNPFGSAVVNNVATYQNLDAKMYFSASSYVPLPVFPLEILPARAQMLLSTCNWWIGINEQGHVTFGVNNFYKLTDAQWLADCFPSPDVVDPRAMSVASTVPIPTDAMSSYGLYLRVYVNAYGAMDSYPGAASAPCVVFFTSADNGATFVQFGDAVSLPPRQNIYVIGAVEDNNVLGGGPYVELWGGSPYSQDNVFLCGTLEPMGYQLNNLPSLQFYGYSLQDSTGRYLCKYDFTASQSLAVSASSLHAYNGAAIITY